MAAKSPPSPMRRSAPGQPFHAPMQPPHSSASHPPTQGHGCGGPTPHTSTTYTGHHPSAFMPGTSPPVFSMQLPSGVQVSCWKFECIFFFFNAAVSSVVGCWSAVALWGAGWLWNVGIRYFEWFIQDVDSGQLMQAPIPTKPVQFQDF